MIEFLHTDCMKYMKQVPNKYFDLAIVDFEYGIDVGNMAYLKEVNTTVKQKNGTKLNGNRNKKPYTKKNWDKNPPSQQYFDELKRISNNQIMFGIEYVNWTGVGDGRIRWDKGVPDGMSFNRYEVAYCSLIKEIVELPLLWAGMMQAASLSAPMVQQGNKSLNEKRIHPTHKPVLLYKALLKTYAKEGDKIFDSHGGGMSIAIACHDMKFDAVICEIDKDYYEAGVKRFELHKQQLQIW